VRRSRLLLSLRILPRPRGLGLGTATTSAAFSVAFQPTRQDRQRGMSAEALECHAARSSKIYTLPSQVRLSSSVSMQRTGWPSISKVRAFARRGSIVHAGKHAVSGTFDLLIQNRHKLGATLMWGYFE